MDVDGSAGCRAETAMSTSGCRRSATAAVECSTRAAFCIWPLRTCHCARFAALTSESLASPAMQGWQLTRLTRFLSQVD